jgi:hypothetical protein
VGYLFALTIPGLAVALVVLGAADVLLHRRSGRRLLGSRRRVGAIPVAYDEAAALFAPGKRIELEQRQSVELLRQTEDDGRTLTAVDLDRGVARVVRPADGLTER